MWDDSSDTEASPSVVVPAARALAEQSDGENKHSNHWEFFTKTKATWFI